MQLWSWTPEGQTVGYEVQGKQCTKFYQSMKEQKEKKLHLSCRLDVQFQGSGDWEGEESDQIQWQVTLWKHGKYHLKICTPSNCVITIFIWCSHTILALHWNKNGLYTCTFLGVCRYVSVCDVYFCGDQLNIHSNFLCLR